MNSKSEKDKAKQLQEKCQTVLNNLLRDEDNKYCVDCDSKGPRWASWNIGVFLCIRCAGIHRNLGVHISRVKSVNLDSWTPEQVVSLQQMGNSRARAVYEANLPDNFRRPQNDSNLETFIRAKYEHKKYIAREWVPAPLPKVNWEKEIEEEMEKQKRKSKTIVEKKPLAAVEVPHIPKPKNPSPKPNRIVNTEKQQAPASTTTLIENDLLIAQNPEDSFSNFLSSTPASTIIKGDGLEKKEDGVAKNSDNNIKSSEEESFFNQTLPTEKEKIQLSKDSIMKLYSSVPSTTMNNFNQFHNSNPLLLGQTGFQPLQQQQQNAAFQNFGCFPQIQQQFQQQQQQPPLQYQGQQFPNQCVGQQFPSLPTGGQMMMTMTAPSSGAAPPFYHHHQQQFGAGAANFQSNLLLQQQQQQNNMSMAAQLSQFGAQTYNNQPQQHFPNLNNGTTFNNVGQNNLNQQFGKMNLNGQNGGVQQQQQQPQGVASNLWQ